jgi:hypothetical protein
MTMIARIAGIGMVLGLLATSLVGCGVRGALDGPSANGSKSGAATTTAAATKPGEPAPKPPHKDFFLDGLIR